MDAAEVLACINVTVDGIVGPLYDKCVKGGCEKIKQYVPQFAKFCPMKKGSKYSIYINMLRNIKL